MLKTNYYAWKNGGGYVDKEIESRSLDHVIRTIMEDGDYANYDDFAKNAGHDWHLFVEEDEVDLLCLINKNNYQWLWDEVVDA